MNIIKLDSIKNFKNKQTNFKHLKNLINKHQHYKTQLESFTPYHATIGVATYVTNLGQLTLLEKKITFTYA